MSEYVTNHIKHLMHLPADVAEDVDWSDLPTSGNEDGEEQPQRPARHYHRSGSGLSPKQRRQHYGRAR